MSAADERVYLLLLRQPDSRTDPDAVRRLVELGFLTAREDGSVAAVDPRTALNRLIERRLHEVDSARAALPSLLAEASAGDTVDQVERIEGRDAAQRRVWEVTAPAHEILAMHRERPRVAESILERTLRGLGRGVAYRTVVHRDLLANPETADYLLRIHRAGDRHRVTEEDVQPLIIADRAAAFVPIQPGRADSGALLVRQPAIVTLLVELFEHTWARATDLEPEPDWPSEAELAALGELDRHAKDESAARALGISVRTFRARVAVVMARLGAANRFQAGVRAKAKGWI